jgi:hypothetical protein
MTGANLYLLIGMSDFISDKNKLTGIWHATGGGVVYNFLAFW